MKYEVIALTSFVIDAQTPSIFMFHHGFAMAGDKNEHSTTQYLGSVLPLR